MDFPFQPIQSGIKTLEETYSLIEQYSVGIKHITELSNLQKDICSHAKIIFPDLANLDRETFNLEKQKTWQLRNLNENNKNNCYQRLINLQKNVKQSIKYYKGLPDTSPIKPVVIQSFLPSKQLESTEHILLESSIITMQEIEGNFKIHRDITTGDSKNIYEGLMRNDPKRAKKELLSLKYNPDHHELFIHLASQFQKDDSLLNLLFEILDSEEGGLGLYGIQLKINCLEACKWSVFLKNQTQYIRELRSLCAKLLNPGLWQCINKHLIPLFSNCPQSARNGLFPFFSKGINAPDKQIRKDIIQTICCVYHIDPDELFGYLVKALKDRDSEVREAGVYALSKLNLNQLQQIFPTIESLIEDNSPSVRRTLAWSFRQNKTLIFKKTFLFLLLLLEDPVEEVSQEAMLSLFKMEKPIHSETVDSLKQLYDRSEKIKKEKIIAILAEWQQEILLLQIAIDEPLLRSNAIEALRKIGCKAPEKLTSQLLLMLSQQDASCVYQEILPSLIELLAVIGLNQREESKLLLEKLKKEKNPSILSSISYAIGHLYRTNQEKGCFQLKEFVLSTHEIVRISAIKALGQLATRYPDDQTPPSNDNFLYSMIQMNLDDSSASIRKATVEALIGFAEFADTRVIPLLDAKIKEEKNGDVRASLIDLIINIGKYFPNELKYLTQFFEPEESLTNHIHALKGFLFRESNYEFLIKRIHPIIIKSEDNQFANEEEAELFAQQLFELLNTMIQHKTLAQEFNIIEGIFIKCLQHPNTRIKQHAIKELPKINSSSLDIIDLLKPFIEAELPAVMQALVSLKGPLKLNADFIAQLIDTFNSRKKDHEVAFKILCQTDLSPYPNFIYSLLHIQYKNALQSTSFDCLLKQYEKTNNEIYLFAVVHKCLTDNTGLFTQDNCLCIWSNKKLIQFHYINLPIAALFNYEKKLFEWRAERLEKEFYVLAGYYYRKANHLDKMMSCLYRGKEIFGRFFRSMQNIPKIKPADALKAYPEIEQCLEALCALGMCYQTGVGLKLTKEVDTKADRLKQSLEFYQPGHTLFDHYLSKYLISICFVYGLGTKRNPQDAEIISNNLDVKSIVPPFPLHIFNLSPYAFCCDLKQNLNPIGTISLALATLESTVLPIDHVKEVMLTSKTRLDHKLLCPYVELHPSTGDLIILIPKKLADNQLFINKILQLGLVQRKVKEKKSCGNKKRTFTIEFAVPKLEIESFLRDELHLNDRVYFELMEVKKGKK